MADRNNNNNNNNNNNKTATFFVSMHIEEKVNKHETGFFVCKSR